MNAQEYLKKRKGKLISLNEYANGAAEYIKDYVDGYAETYKDTKPIIYVEMGSAYGGNVEDVAEILKGKGLAIGFDTFEGHPRHLARNSGDREATCMDHWYQDDIFGTARLNYEYQTQYLKDNDLNNAMFVKGEVTRDSLLAIPYVNIAFLDMDILHSMREGYEAIKNKVVPGGYIIMHDVVARDNLPALREWFLDEVYLPNIKSYQIMEWLTGQHLAILKVL